MGITLAENRARPAGRPAVHRGSRRSPRRADDRVGTAHRHQRRDRAPWRAVCRRASGGVGDVRTRRSTRCSPACLSSLAALAQLTAFRQPLRERRRLRSRSAMQLLMRSMVWSSVRAAAGSGCAAKNALMSSRDVRVAERRRATAMRSVSPPKMVDLRLELRPVLLHERPGARRARLRRRRTCARDTTPCPGCAAADVERVSRARSMSAGSRKCGKRVQVAIVLVGRVDVLGRGEQRVVQRRVAVLGRDGDDRAGERRVERRAARERTVERRARLGCTRPGRRRSCRACRSAWRAARGARRCRPPPTSKPDLAETAAEAACARSASNCGRRRVRRQIVVDEVEPSVTLASTPLVRSAPKPAASVR